MDDPRAELRDELRQVEDELAELRKGAAELRQRIGERWDAPTDAVELSTLITMAEEQEALINVLEARREDLLKRLGEA